MTTFFDLNELTNLGPIKFTSHGEENHYFVTADGTEGFIKLDGPDAETERILAELTAETKPDVAECIVNDRVSLWECECPECVQLQKDAE